MTSNDGGVAFLGFVFLGIGLLLFTKGLLLYRRYRMLSDMPRMPIRSVAMGLVEIEGVAIPVQPVLSPVTRTPCLLYKVEISSVEREKGGYESCTSLGTDRFRGKFLLQDETGKILVDPEGANLHLERLIQCKTQPPGSIALGTPPAPSLGPAISDEELNQYGEAFAARRPQRPLRTTFKKFWIWAFYNRGGVYIPTGAFQFTEYCLPAYQTYLVAGTCEENPAPRDDNDRNIIRKDQKHSVLIIRKGTEKRVESTMRVMSVLAVFGGAALAVYALASLLHEFDLLRFPWT
jgi:hypothetical protein